VGVAAILVAVAGAPEDARAATAQTWPAFVLVAGLLLVGLVAHEDGLFSAGGHALARVAPNGVALYAGTALLVVTVTTLLNLDTSVSFVTPVLVYAARSRGEGEAPLLYGCLLLSNAGSLLLPGSNLTNVIVLDHFHVSGGAYFSHMAVAALTAALVTAGIVGVAYCRQLTTTLPATGTREKVTLGVGLLAVVAVTILVVGLHSPAVPVLVVGIAAVAWRSRGFARRGSLPEAVGVLGPPVLVGLFGVAVALGTLGRTWDGPATALAHLDAWGTAALAAGSSIVVNNLPAAALLAARRPPHPYALLVGLNVGPNLFVSGSLSWVLWLRAARAAGGRPSIRRASLLGVVSVPLAIAAAVGLLVATGTS
jgi:arsenical pump membrane protein